MNKLIEKLKMLKKFNTYYTVWTINLKISEIQKRIYEKKLILEEKKLLYSKLENHLYENINADTVAIELAQLVPVIKQLEIEFDKYQSMCNIEILKLKNRLEIYYK